MKKKYANYYQIIKLLRNSYNTLYTCTELAIMIYNQDDPKQIDKFKTFFF